MNKFELKIMCDKNKKIIFEGALSVRKDTNIVTGIFDVSSENSHENIFIERVDASITSITSKTDNIFINGQFTENGTAFRHKHLGITILKRGTRIHGDNGFMYSFFIESERISTFPVSSYIIKEIKEEDIYSPNVSDVALLLKCPKNRCRLKGTCASCRSLSKSQQNVDE